MEQHLTGMQKVLPLPLNEALLDGLGALLSDVRVVSPNSFRQRRKLNLEFLHPWVTALISLLHTQKKTIFITLVPDIFFQLQLLSSYIENL